MSQEQDSHDQQPFEQITEKQLEFALFQIQNLQELIQRTDSKAQFVVGGNALLITVVIALFSNIRTVLLNNALAITLVFVGILLGFMVASLVSMVRAFFVVYPRAASLPVEGSRSAAGHLLYFRGIVHSYHSPDEYCHALACSSLQDILAHVAAEIYALSVVASKKYDLLRVSTRWLIASLIMWVIILMGALIL